MNKWYKIKDHEHLRRDSTNQAILNTNVQEAREYELRSKMINGNRHNADEINNIKEKLSKVDKLEDDLREIKALLQRIVNK